MRKILLFLSIIGILVLSSGCSATWDGMKQDTSNAWNGTKSTIHNATE